jgi:hypothetical protein
LRAGAPLNGEGRLGYNGCVSGNRCRRRPMKTIVHPYPGLVHFVALLTAPFSKPQRAHLLRLADALCTCPGPKTLAALRRQFLDAPDESNFADFLRESPWDEGDLEGARRRLVVADLLRRGQAPGQPLRVAVSLDDSTTAKDKGTQALQAVDWTFDHSQQRPCKGAVHVALRLHVGAFSYAFSWRLYLRASTVRRLNKQRPEGQRLKFRSKLRLAQEMLEELRPYLPRGAAVYVLFDRWYASADLVRFIRRQGWHVIGALKSNRKLNGARLDVHDKRLKHLWYARVSVATAGGATATYRVRSVTGRLQRVSGLVRVLISRRHTRDRRPKYFLCTDLTLSLGEILTWYQKRWSQEVDFWYLKQELGLGDFRVQAYEAITKWYALAYLALTFLTWRLYEGQGEGAPWGGVSDVLADIRAWHARDVLESACREVLATGDVGGVVRRFVNEPPRRQAG